VPGWFQAALTLRDAQGKELASADHFLFHPDPLLEYEIPGMTEAMRRDGLRSTPHAMLSRQLAGVMQGRLVIALPGSPGAVDQGLKSAWRVLPHALQLLAGDTAHGKRHPPT